MLVYWLLFAFFAVGVLLSGDARRLHANAIPPMLLLGAASIWLAIGLRYEVGADWETYKFLFSYAGYADLDRVLEIGDPGYQLVSWIVQRIGGEIWTLNLVCGLVFTWGLVRFTRAQPDPWLALLVAIPYLVVVVAMGYTRQALAIGILMAGLASVERGGSILRFAIYVACAALFHKTAVVVLPLVVFASERNRLLNLLAGIAGCILLYDLFLADSVEGFVQSYIEREYSSQGAAIRVAMNFIPGATYFLFRRRLQFGPIDDSIWRYFSIAALAMPILLFVSPSSTAIDRLALYLIPLQVAVLPRVKYLFAREGQGKLFVVAYAALVLFVWLTFAAHAKYWVPYRLYPDLFG